MAWNGKIQSANLLIKLLGTVNRIQQMISIVYMSYKEITINKCLPVPVSLVYPNYKQVASSYSSSTYVAICNQAETKSSGRFILSAKGLRTEKGAKLLHYI